MPPEEIKKLRRSGRRQAEEVVEGDQDDKMMMGQAEVTRDEFGGYCCKRWGSNDTGTNQDSTKIGVKITKESVYEDNICELLGLDINKKALEIVKADFKRKKIPFSKASKHLLPVNPNSTHSSAVKSYNASATKSSAKPNTDSANKNSQAVTTAPSAFLTYDTKASTTPYKRARVDSSSFGQEQLFAPHEASTHSKRSVQNPTTDK